MTNTNDTNGRLERSARTLLAFYGRKLQTTLVLLTQAPDEVTDEHVVFGPDLRAHGLWGLHGERPLTGEERGDVANTFSAILGADSLCTVIGGGDGGGDTGAEEPLRRFTTKLHLAHADPCANVLSMTAARRRRDFPAGLVVGPAAKRQLKRDCLIEANDVREVHKLAFELHSRGDRRIFLRLVEFDESTRTCFTTLLNLGPITLFVPEIMALTEAEQNALATLTDFHWEVRPLVIVGSRSSLAELRANPSINPDLLRTLSQSHLQLFGPMNRTQDLDPWLDELEREDA